MFVSEVEYDRHPFQSECTPALSGRGVLSAKAKFGERARYYRALDAELGDTTRFFAAAAWINNLLAWLSALRLLSSDAEYLLESLGSDLQRANDHVARRMRRYPTSRSAALDRALVHWEQCAVEHHLHKLEDADPSTYGRACQHLDTLLNHVILRRVPAGPWPALSIFGSLGRNARLRVGKLSDREAIGVALIRALNPP